MARRMYDLNSGSEDVIVKDAKIIGANGLTIFRDNSGMYASAQITSTDAGISFTINDTLVSSFSTDEYVFSIYFPLSLAKYTTAEIPQDVYEGSIIYDSTRKKCILWNGTAWVNLDGSSLGE